MTTNLPKELRIDPQLMLAAQSFLHPMDTRWGRRLQELVDGSPWTHLDTRLVRNPRLCVVGELFATSWMFPSVDGTDARVVQRLRDLSLFEAIRLTFVRDARGLQTMHREVVHIYNSVRGKPAWRSSCRAAPGRLLWDEVDNPEINCLLAEADEKGWGQRASPAGELHGQPAGLMPSSTPSLASPA